MPSVSLPSPTLICGGFAADTVIVILSLTTRCVAAIVEVSSDDASLTVREKVQEIAIREDLDASLVGQLDQVYGVGAHSWRADEEQDHSRAQD